MNIGLHLKRSAKCYAQKTALIFNDQRMTFEEFNSGVNRLANGLIDMGIQKGERVALLSMNCDRLVVALYACYKTGLVTVPLNSRVSEDEIVQMLNHSEARVLFIGPDFMKYLEYIKRHAHTVTHFIALYPHPSLDMDCDKLGRYGEDEPDVEVSPEDLAELRYTSGTTGVMKAAVLPHRSILAKARKHMLVSGIDIKYDSVICHTAPITHASGGWMLPFIARGGCNILHQKFEPKYLLETIEKYRVTHLFVVPTQLNMLMKYEKLGDYDLSSISTIVYGASPMPPERLKQAFQTFGPVLVQGYGQSETGSGFIFLHKEDHIVEDDSSTRRYSSVGVPCFECDVKIVDPEGNEVAPGEVGEIIERGPGDMVGYWRDPELTAKIIRDGWIYTGDMATIDKDGYIYIVDRKTDMIISGGFNVFPSEVENALYRHPGVQETAVIGIPDDQWGEAICAFVVLKPDQNVGVDELMAHCDRCLSRFKKPKQIFLVDQLPKNNTGKTLRRELKEQFWKDQERMVN